MKRIAYAVVLMLAGAGLHALAMQKPAPGGYVIETDREVAKDEPGTHNGGGQTVGYSFFKNVPNIKLVFRKRALKRICGTITSVSRRASARSSGLLAVGSNPRHHSAASLWDKSPPCLLRIG